MRIALALALAALAASGQQRNNTSPTGFGRILFPGGTAPGGGSPFGRIIYPGTGAPAVARNVNAVPTPPASHPGHSGTSLIPFPVYFGGNFLQYDPPQAPQVGTPSYQADAPIVIVNQYFRPDAPPPVQVPVAQTVSVREEAKVTAENQDKDTIFLIAMKDHTIYAANAYWVEDATLHYITIQGSQNSVSMDLVDRELSARLNRDRHVTFGLPAN